MKWCKMYSVMGFLFVAGICIAGPSIWVQPTSQQSFVGDPVGIEIGISGLDHPGPLSVGAYNFRVAYDPSVLDWDSLVFGDPIQGNQLDIFGLGTLQMTTPDEAAGSLDVWEASLDLPEDLDAYQSDSFILATLLFTASWQGITNIVIDSFIFGDALGDPLMLDNSQASAAVECIPGNIVPAPGALLLAGIGTGLVGWFRRR